jgi:hypothetical protein
VRSEPSWCCSCGGGSGGGGGGGVAASFPYLFLGGSAFAFSFSPCPLLVTPVRIGPGSSVVGGSGSGRPTGGAYSITDHSKSRNASRFSSIHLLFQSFRANICSCSSSVASLFPYALLGSTSLSLALPPYPVDGGAGIGRVDDGVCSCTGSVHIHPGPDAFFGCATLSFSLAPYPWPFNNTAAGGIGGRSSSSRMC